MAGLARRQTVLATFGRYCGLRCPVPGCQVVVQGVNEAHQRANLEAHRVIVHKEA